MCAVSVINAGYTKKISACMDSVD